MAKITYNLSSFDPVKAKQGALCVMVASAYSESTIINTSNSFGGAGICRYKDVDRYLLTINSILYSFNERGNPVDNISSNYKLLLGEVLLELSGAGGAVESNVRTVITRSAEGTYSSETTEEDNTLLVEGLTTRDNFALSALKALMQRADKDPSSFSNNEMAFYCDVAYLWASNMMSAAANVRAELDDLTVTEEVKEEGIGSLETNTEKLLNNIWSALRKTDYEEEIEPEEEGEDPIKIYSERIYNPKQDELLKAFLGHTPESAQDEQLYAKFEDFTLLLKNLQETIDSKVYERILIKDFDTLLTKLDTMNTNLANINTSIQSFTSALNNRMTALDDHITSALSTIINAMPSTSGLATSSDVSSAESSIIAAMPTCKYTPPSNN